MALVNIGRLHLINQSDILARFDEISRKVYGDAQEEITKVLEKKPQEDETKNLHQ